MNYLSTFSGGLGGTCYASWPGNDHVFLGLQESNTQAEENLDQREGCKVPKVCHTSFPPLFTSDRGFEDIVT